jgi:hypothetical protein
MDCFVASLPRNDRGIARTCHRCGLTKVTLAASEVAAKRNCGHTALAKAEALQEPGRLAVLHWLLLRCSGVRCRRDRHRRTFFPGPRSMMSRGPDLRSSILHGPDPSVLLRGPDLRWCILHHLYRSSLHGLFELDLCPCFLFVRPSLELLEQGFSEWPADLGLALIGRFNSRSSFVARRRVTFRRRQILSAGD